MDIKVGPSSAKQVLKKQTGSRSSNDAGFGKYTLNKTQHEDKSVVRALGDDRVIEW